MEESVFQLIICFAILCLLLVYPWIRRTATVGLPFCYILSLAIIHWLGALIHVLPMPFRSGPDLFTQLGFREVFWATIAFAVGSLLIAPFILRMTIRGETRSSGASLKTDQLGLAYVYL